MQIQSEKELTAALQLQRLAKAQKLLEIARGRGVYGWLVFAPLCVLLEGAGVIEEGTRTASLASESSPRSLVARATETSVWYHW